MPLIPVPDVLPADATVELLTIAGTPVPTSTNADLSSSSTGPKDPAVDLYAPAGTYQLEVDSPSTRPTRYVVRVGYLPPTPPPETGGGGGDVVDATASVKGILRLAGDLDGTADSPSIADALIASLLDRANHTGQIPASVVSDFATQVLDDVRGAFLYVDRRIRYAGTGSQPGRSIAFPGVLADDMDDVHVVWESPDEPAVGGADPPLEGDDWEKPRVAT